MASLLFVCTGNTCRSVLAEYLLKGKLKEMGEAPWQIESCGLAAWPGGTTSPKVLQILKAKGIDASAHTPTLLDEKSLDAADFVFVMEKRQKDWIENCYPKTCGKVHVLKEFAHQPGESDIQDPIGGTDEVYAHCTQEIENCLEIVLERILHEKRLEKN